MPYVDGKCAVVTGAASGIGRALARQLNREGCALYLSDIDAANLDATLAALPRRDVPAQSRIVDVADRAAMHAWAADIADERGRVDIVVNNAGVALMSMVEDCDYDNFEWLMGINFWGVIHGTQAFLPLLRKAPQGHLVNLSSVFGLIAVPTQSAYNASKFAVRGYTEALRQEMDGSNVHICCVHPGGIRTNIARAARVTNDSISADERGRTFERMARTTPEEAAAQIIRAIEKRSKRLLIGRDAQVISLLTRLFPVNYTRFIPKLGQQGNALSR